MMDNITIGEYVPGSSWIYKMDPRMKIILTFISMVVIFLLPTLASVAIALGVFFLIFITTRIPIIKMLKGLKPILYLVLFSFILQLIYTKTGKLLYTFDFSFNFYNMLMIIGVSIFYFIVKRWIPLKFTLFVLFIVSIWAIQYYFDFKFLFNLHYKLRIYEGGLNRGGFVVLRVILMISITSLLTFSTSSMEINNGISSVLKPLKLVHIPVGIFSMMLSLTLRFIPTLLTETKKIMNAQSSRGVDFNEGNIKEKVKQIISLLVPMFVVSFKRAEELSNAMISRGYDLNAPRSRYDILKLHLIDYIGLILILAALGAAIYLRVA